MPRRLVVPVLIAAAVAGCSHSGAAATGVVVRAPGLAPAFSASVPDYTAPCKDRSITVHGEAPAGHTVSIDGSAPESGSFERSVPLRPGQAFRMVVDSSTHYVRCVPQDFPRWKVERHGTPVAR